MMTRLFRRQFCVVSTEKRTYMPTDPVILITGIYPSKKKKNNYTRAKKQAECARTLIAALFIMVKK